MKELYAIPRALEIATGILMHHVQTGERLYSDDPWTYTRCQEIVNKNCHAVIGGFRSSGLCLSNLDDNWVISGLGGVLKF